MNTCDGGSCGSPDYQHLARASDPRAAQLLCAELERRGVPVVQAQGPRGSDAHAAAPATETVDLYVAADRIEDAQRILADLEP